MFVLKKKKDYWDYNMKIAAIQYPVFNPYNQPTIEIYIAGCTNNCSGCHTPELQNYNIGKKLDFGNLKKIFEKYEGFYDNVSILGGDLLCQNIEEAKTFTMSLSSYFWGRNIDLWLFTGKDEVPDWCKKYYDKIKYGKYDENLKQEGFPASSNQKLIYKGIDY